MSMIDTLDEWREIAEQQTYQIEEALKRNMPEDTILRCYLDALPGQRPDPQNPDKLYGLTFWVTHCCAEHHPGADAMVFDDVYQLIVKAHSAEQLADFTAEYPSPELVDRTFRRAMHTWAIIRDRIIEMERYHPTLSVELSLKLLKGVLGVKDVRTAKERATRDFGLRELTRQSYQIDLHKLQVKDPHAFARYQSLEK